ncbi:DUF6089 family protein [Marinoscillum sp.]|uniref:type IX secretion system protein PorG n=1 Tax=Marinoscillum sp. TaxID=2024838 RepID=UPI003BAB92D4
MKKVLFLCFVLASVTSQAQFIEFGGGIGASHYTGDLVHYPHIEFTRPGVTGMLRLNLSNIVSFKTAFTYMKLVGNDDSYIDALGQQRQHSFNHNVYELSSVFEYHFLSYRSDKTRNKWAPYAMLGLGFANIQGVEPTYEEFNQIQVVIPMGGGVKYELTKQLTLGVELGARKTFFDYLDGVSDGDTRIKNYQYGNPNDKDWYFYSGINLTFVLYKIPCPYPYVPNRAILSRIRAN